MPLRDYQEECLANVGKARSEGVRSMLAVSPTGTGKGEILANLPRPEALDVRPGNKMLTVVHKIELCDDLAERYARYNPKLKVGIEREKYVADADCDLVVASVQTIGNPPANDPNGFCDRLKKFRPDDFTYCAIDEVHHAARPGSSYSRILRYFNMLKGDPNRDPEKLVFGFTATPGRADNIGLETILDQMVFQRDVLTMMRTGLTVGGDVKPWLCELKSYRVETNVSLDNVASRQGDFATKALEKEVNTPERNNLVVDEYLKLGEGASFFAFTVDVQHSEDLAETFIKRGVTTVAVSAGTKDRKQLIELFKQGKIRGLVSCGVLSEGIDIPMVGCLLMCRPTQSPLLYRQQIGRGFRPFPAPERLFDCWMRGINPGFVKPYCIVVDYVDACSRHQLNTAPSILGLRPDFNMKGQKALAVVEEVERIKATKPAINASLYTNLDALKAISEKIDLFAVPVVPSEVATISKFAWTTGVSEGVYQLSLPDKGMLTVRQNALGGFEIAKHVTGVKTPLGSATDLAGALKIAEKSVPPEAMVVLRSDAGWRNLGPSEPQMRAIKALYPELRRPFKTDAEFFAYASAQYTRGQASMMISARSNNDRRR